MSQIRQTDIRDAQQVSQKVKIENIQQSQSNGNGKQQKFTQKGSHNCNKWGNLQRLRYMIFLIKYHKFLQWKSTYNKVSWYQKMSVSVGDSYYVTSKGYHQSYLKRFQNIKNIIDHLRNNIYFEKEEIETETLRIEQITKAFQERQIKSLNIPNELNFTSMKFKPYNVEFLNQCVDQDYFLPKTFFEFQNQERNQNKVDIKIPFQILLIIERKQKQQTVLSSYQSKKLERIIESFRKNELIFEQKRRIRRKKKKSKLLHLKSSQKKKICRSSFFQKRKKLNFSKKIQHLNDNQETISKNRKRKVVWKKSQAIKIMLFAQFNKKIFQPIEKREKNELFLKCSKYINTQKTPQNCKQRISSLCWKYNKQIQILIDSQSNRLGITPQIIMSQKEHYENIQKNYVEIKIDIQPSEFKIQLKNQTINEVVDFDIKTQILVSFKKMEKNKSEMDIQFSQQDQKELKQLKKKGIKAIIRLQTIDIIFQNVQKNQNRWVYGLKNFIFMRKLAEIKISS